MINIIISFFLGMLIVPLIYSILPSIIAEISKKRRFALQNKSSLYISERLRSIIEKGTDKTHETFWINALIQRYYSELIKNYAFENRIRNMFSKSFISAIKTGIIKNTKIISLGFGFEAPYVKSIKILTPQEFNSLVKKTSEMEDIDFESLAVSVKEQLDEDEKQIEKDFSTNKIVIDEKNDYIDTSSIAKEFKILTNNSKTIEFIDDNEFPLKNPDLFFNDNSIQEIYRNLIFLVDIEYYGGFNSSLEIELPQNIFVNSLVTLKHIKGSVLLRLPAENYDTRFEISFLKETFFDFQIESGINSKNSKIYFQSSVTKLLKTTILYTLRKMIVFPNWYHQNMGFIPSIKDIEHKTIKFSPENISDILNIAESILLYTSCDYKIINQKNGILFRINNYYINRNEHIYQFEFSLPIGKSLLTNPIIVDFENLDAQDSRLMNKFADLSILEGVISGFKEISIIYSLKNISILILKFSNASYEFVRVTTKNAIIFQRNDPINPDFLVFKIIDKKIQIFSYITTKDYEFTEKRIHKLKAKVHSQPMSVLGSEILYKFMHLKRKNNFKPQSRNQESYLQVNNKNSFEELSQLEDLFYEALNLQENETLEESRRFKVSKECLLKIINEDSIRIKLYAENGKIFRRYQESSKIRSFVIEQSTQKNDFLANHETNEILVHTFNGEDFIVDIVTDTSQIFIYKIAIKGDQECLLTILSKLSALKCFLKPFFETIQIQISLKRLYDIVNGYNFERGSSEFNKEFKTSQGGVWFEFFTDFEDDFQLKITSCKKNMTIFEIYKVISSRKTKIFIPTENDFLKIVLIPKYKRNKYIQYKIVFVEIENEAFVDTNIGLGHNCKYMMRLRGMPKLVLFWDRDFEKGIKSYVEESSNKTLIENSGVIRMDYQDYRVVLKNKEEKKRNIRIFIGALTID